MKSVAATFVGASVLLLAVLPAHASVSLPSTSDKNSRQITERSGAWDPSAAPQRLTDFVERINKSVVTVFCRNGLGSGWAAATRLPQSALDSGYKRFIVTNAHVIQGCTQESAQYIEIRQNGVAYPARVWNWNWDQDLAAVVTTAELPVLQWDDVPKPRVGQWVAAFGSPFGLAGSATFGYVSFVGNIDLISSAPINRGNSGGPLVDNEGRVVGINTAGIDGTNSIGIVQGTPLMCGTTHICDGTTPWLSGATPSAPLGVTLRQEGTDIVVTWSAPKSDGGQSIYKYTASVGPGDRFCNAYTTLSCRLTKQGKADPGLRLGETYTISVQAFNVSGAGAESSATITMQQVPGRVTNLKSAPSTGGAVVTWAAPKSPSSVTITGYQYRVGTGAWKTTKAPRATLKGLKRGATVRVTVTAVNVAGPGAATTVTFKVP